MKVLRVEDCTIKEAIVALGIYHNGHKLPNDGEYKVRNGTAYVKHISKLVPNPSCRQRDYIITRLRSELRVYDCNQEFILDTIGGNAESWGTVYKINMGVLNEWLISPKNIRVCDILQIATLNQLGFPTKVDFDYNLADKWDGKTYPKFVRVWPSEEDEILEFL